MSAPVGALASKSRAITAPSRSRFGRTVKSRSGMDASQRAAALVEFSEDPIIGLTLDGLVTDWNPAAERLYGYSEDEMLGASIAVLVPPELRGRTGNLLENVRAGEVV